MGRKMDSPGENLLSNTHSMQGHWGCSGSDPKVATEDTGDVLLPEPEAGSVRGTISSPGKECYNYSARQKFSSLVTNYLSASLMLLLF